MKAAVLFETKKPFELVDVEIDALTPREVLVRVKACGLCHSDWHCACGDIPSAVPVVLGHEAAGIVEAVGSEVTTVKAGDHVVGSALVFCGHCDPCVSGRTHMCAAKPDRRKGEPSRLRLDGRPVAQGMRMGGFAEQMLVPYALALYFAGVDASAVNDGRAKDALANGQCMLFLRQPYEFVGGHRPVHKSVIEDVEMAHTMKRHRMKMRVLRAEHLGTVRMYDSLAAIWRGFRKNAFLFLRLDARLAAQVIVTSILLTSIGPVALWLASSNQWLVLGALLVWPAVLLRSWYSGWLGPLLYLPAIYVFQAIALHGMASALFGWDARWKGRRV